MFKFFRRHEVGDADHTDVRRPPPPTTPIEIGFSLRSAREREQLSLEEVRARTDVPMVDLDALERGRLDLFHVEQAAIVGLWRYAEAVGLEPDGLVDVVRRSWPNPAVSVDAMNPIAGMSSTPLAQLAVATSLLAPITSPHALMSQSSKLGLSPSMLSVLSSASLGASRAVAAIGPSRTAPEPVAQAKLTGARKTSTPGKKSSAKRAKAPAPKKAVTPPRRAESVPAISASPSLSATPVSPAVVEIPEAPRLVANEPVLRQFPTPSPVSVKRAPSGAPANDSEDVDPDTIMVPKIVVDPIDPGDPEELDPEELDLSESDLGESDLGVNTADVVTPRPVGHWAERLSKVVAERFGVDPTRRQR